MPKAKISPQKLNIAIVCDAVTDCVAGSFISTLRFSELLSARGHKIIFIAARSPQNPQDNWHKNIKAYRFPALLLPKTEKQLYIAFPTPAKIKKILREEKIDVVHVIIPTPSAVSSMRAAKALGLKIVVHSHTQPENLTMHIPGRPLQRFLNWIFYKYLSWLYKKAHALIYPSEFSKRLLPPPVADMKTLVISNGVDIGKFKKVDAKKIFDKFNLPPRATNILYLGRLHPEKSVDTLIKALPRVIAEHPEAHVLIAGFGHLDQKLLKLAHQLGVKSYITFLGKISDEEVIMAYNACDIFVLPSLAELEGMAVLEAMACGKPLIVANSKDSASVYFVDENGLLFEPKNHEDLARQIIRLLSNKDLRGKMGEASLTQSKRYDIGRSIAQLEELYYSILRAQ